MKFQTKNCQFKQWNISTHMAMKFMCLNYKGPLMSIQYTCTCPTCHWYSTICVHTFQKKLGIMHLPMMAMKIPAWFTLQKFEMEINEMGWEVAFNLGRLLGFDKWTFQSTKQRYCIALEVGNGWKITLQVKNEVNGGSSIMLIIYDYVSIRH